MEIIEISDEEKPQEYLQEKGILKKYEECTYCGGKNLGRVRQQKIKKCYSCRRGHLG